MSEEPNRYCIVCYNKFYSPTGRANQCPTCRGFDMEVTPTSMDSPQRPDEQSSHKRISNREAEELLQEKYRQGLMPQIDGIEIEDHLEIREDERYSEEDIYEMFGLNDEEDEDEWDY